MKFFTGYTLGAFCVMLALLMVVTVISEIVIDSDLHPRTKFQAMFVETLISLAFTSTLIERMNLHLLDN